MSSDSRRIWARANDSEVVAMTARNKIYRFRLYTVHRKCHAKPTMSVCPSVMAYGSELFRKERWKQSGVAEIYRYLGGCRYYTGQKDGIQPTEHAPHVLIPVPRRSQSCNRLLQSAALCAAFSVSGSSFTTLEYKSVSHEMATAQLDDIQGLQGASNSVWG